jgi:hypothetical protein
MRYLFVLVLAPAMLGCGHTPPATAHDKSVSHWVESLRDGDARARRKAVHVLSNVGPADPAVVPALTRAVADPDASIRCAALQALLKFGPDAREAAPAVEVCRTDRDPRVRAYALTFLERLR